MEEFCGNANAARRAECMRQRGTAGKTAKTSHDTMFAHHHGETRYRCSAVATLSPKMKVWRRRPGEATAPYRAVFPYWLYFNGEEVIASPPPDPVWRARDENVIRVKDARYCCTLFHIRQHATPAARHVCFYASFRVTLSLPTPPLFLHAASCCHMFIHVLPYCHA